MIILSCFWVSMTIHRKTVSAMCRVSCLGLVVTSHVLCVCNS